MRSRSWKGWRGSASAGSPRSTSSAIRSCRRSSGPMSGMRSGPPPERPQAQGRFRKRRIPGELLLGFLIAAAFVLLFYVWGEEWIPRGLGRLGGFYPLVGAVALTLAVALFLTEWFRFAGREGRKVRLAARGFLFLCSLSIALFLFAKALLILAPGGATGTGSPSLRAFAYLIPLPAFAMVVRVLLNSEVAILFTVAASVLSAASAHGRWSSLFFLLLAGTAAAARSGRVGDRYRMLWAGVLTAPVWAAAAFALEFAFHGPAGALWAAL